MTDANEVDPEQASARLRKRAARNLSDLVIIIEFTLISVMAGVVLAPLADRAAGLLRGLRFETWPYILFGILYILFMWSGVLSHAFSFVGWPFELSHNLTYIAWALVLAMQMTFMEDPVGWFAMNILQYLVAAWIGYTDLRILRKRLAGAHGPAASLIQMALRRQSLLMIIIPLSLTSALISAGLLAAFPDFFLGQHAHWILALVQAAIIGVGLWHNARSLNAWLEPILQKEMAEIED
jgi:hypothetical protein